MNFDTPPQALTICGEWNKIFEDTRHKRQAAPDCLFARAYPARPGGAARRAANVPAEVNGNYADGKDKEVKPEIVGTVES